MVLNYNPKYKINTYESTLIKISDCKLTGVKQTNLLGRIPNNICRCFTFKKSKHHSPPLKCGLHRDSFQRGQYGKGESKFTMEKPDKQYFSKVVKGNYTMIKYIDSRHP